MNERLSEVENDALSSDPYGAAVDEIRFVVHRHRPADWTPYAPITRDEVLVLALAGKVHYRLEDQRFTAQQGTMVLLPRGIARSAQSDPDDPWSFYAIGFRLAHANEAAKQQYAGLPKHIHIANHTQVAGYFESVHRMWMAREPGFALACKGLILVILEEYIRAATRTMGHIPHASRIQAIVERIHMQVGQVESVESLASLAGLSQSRFRLLFREVTGYSVTRYQNRVRIQTARDLLTTGQYSVTEVAEEMGFNDIYYFSRLFKKMTGITPSACRQGTT